MLLCNTCVGTLSVHVATLVGQFNLGVAFGLLLFETARERKRGRTREGERGGKEGERERETETERGRERERGRDMKR
jgi:hypothetical protein